MRWARIAGRRQGNSRGRNSSHATKLLHHTGVLLAIALVGLIGATPGARATPSLTTTSLPTLGGSYGRATEVNNAGQVFGVSFLSGNAVEHPFVWTEAEGTSDLDLGPLQVTSSETVDANQNGQVVGHYGCSTPPSCDEFVIQRAFSWTASGGMVDLGTFGGSQATAFAVNDSGQVAGRATLPGDVSRAFLWEEGVLTNLGTLGGSSSLATAINNSGQIVGVSYDLTNTQERVFIWANGAMADVGTLGGDMAYPAAISDGGQVVGDSAFESGNGDRHAFSWTQAGGMVDLGTLGGTYSSARAVNEAGHVVGVSTTLGGDAHAFLWTEAGGMVDLGTLGGTYSAPFDISEGGDVVGESRLAADTSTHGFLWTETDGMIDLGTVDEAESTAQAINDAGLIAGWAGAAAVVWQVGSADHDANGDAIADVLQPPGTPAGSFVDDTGAVNTTNGTVLAGTPTAITDADDPAGVLVTTGAEAVRLEMCIPSDPYNIDIPPNTSVRLTCGSLSVAPVSGGSVTVTPSGTTTTVTFAPESSGIVDTPGNTVTVSDVSGDVHMSVDGVSAPVPEGDSTLIQRGTGNDSITGTSGNDVIFDAGGNNKINGNGGDDTIVARAGNDSITGGEGSDWIEAGNGKNAVLGDGGDDNISAGAGNDSIDGGSGTDTCDPGGGKNSIKSCELP